MPDSLAVNELSEVVVTGANRAVDGRYLPYSVSVVGSAEFSLTGYYARGWGMIQTVAMHNENTGRFINKGIEATANLNGASRLYVADDYRHQSYATLSVRAAWQVCRNLELTARFENITDARYTINAGYRMPGFTAFGGFKVSI